MPAEPTAPVAPTPAPDNRILKRMLDRLFASLVNGPSLNCRPHSSRQRIDLVQFAKLKDRAPEGILRALLGPDREAKVTAKVPAPKGARTAGAWNAKPADDEEDDDKLTPAERAARVAFRDQGTVFSKLRTIAEDARTYENDTGVHALQIGFPLLSLPPGGGSKFGLTRRILAPLAFVSLGMTVKAGATPSATLECRNEGADLVVPNIALLAWIEGQTGQPVGELFTDETGEKPWAEIVAIAKRVCELLQVPLPESLSGDEMPQEFTLTAAPRADEDEDPQPKVIAGAVVGLYPMANQGLLRDMQALAGGEPARGPIESFIKVGVSLDAPTAVDETEQPVEKRTRSFAEERLVTVADPCQARAVRLAKTSRGLVVHGPPGTGKSQTIANIIGDHLARGERVLFVCEKRTALDVVMNRLDGMGLGALCGIVHDPQRDQRELYKSIREQLDMLPEVKSDATADTQLGKVDAELQRLHGELAEYHAALMKRPDKDSQSFHELMGKWLELPNLEVEFDSKLVAAVPISTIEMHAQAITDLLARAGKVSYGSNPWRTAAGLALDDYLLAHGDAHRETLSGVAKGAAVVDAAIDPTVPPFAAKADLLATAAARGRVADELTRVRLAPLALRTQWAKADGAEVERAKRAIDDTVAGAKQLATTALDPDLYAIVAPAPPTFARIAEETATLEAYVNATSGVLGFLAFGAKSAATAVLTRYGVQLSKPNATRVVGFLAALRGRLALREALRTSVGATIDAIPLPDDAALLTAMESYRALVGFLSSLEADASLADLKPAIRTALIAADEPADLTLGLRNSTARAKAILSFEKVLAVPLLSPDARLAIAIFAHQGKAAASTIGELAAKLDTLENVLRVRDGLESMPAELKPSLVQLIAQDVDDVEGRTVLHKAAYANEIAARLKANRVLMTADGQRLASSFDLYRKLDTTKRDLVRAALLHRWTSKQKERLLVGGGNRVNALGADLRRRLTIRGERAMRLRQVVHIGENIEGGDPLYDLRPVWLASPETVAQLFPRRAVFDVVVFDEASQCRLEEALPVLLRAKRVVIAGDPKQLPPTRFFESAIALSEDEEETTDEQQLFERQQGEIEDLLAAALNIEIEECYLDVHYRSRNADLIEFSNDNFYGKRLQAIPGHPHNRPQFAPITLYKANGVYEKRENPAEAEKVCEIVRDLLKRATPPSIGIACFNISQRDLIIERLEEIAGEDAAFAKALAEARERRSSSSFEGLFVKNLENVQGDERDHMIISTTYGPDAKGRFYRRFGPVGSAGGGRRLNVLVTRARDEVHIVTSIPETVYRNLPQIPSGETPGGAWLLFAYLVYAETLAAEYEQTHRLMEQVQQTHEPVLNDRPNRFPSNFAKQLGKRLLAQRKIGSDVHWGNDGFCVDLALHHPTRAEDVSVGVLTDLNRFEQAADPVEWEVFRTTILENNGWTLSRVWTPAFFRDREAVTSALLTDADAAVKASAERDAIRVEKK